MLLSRIAFVWLIGVILLGCDDISSVKTATLSVEPDALIFSKPEMDTEQQQLSVEIKNIGNGPSDAVRLTEDDDISELSLLMLMIGRLRDSRTGVVD